MLLITNSYLTNNERLIRGIGPITLFLIQGLNMYIPKKYEEQSWEKLRQIILDNPLATIVTTDPNGKMMANHFPFYLHEDPETGNKYLHAHFAKKNPQVPFLENNDEVLVIFQSPSSYISPSYYPEKKRNEKFVPTWDFASVHITGKLKVIDDPEFVRRQLVSFTDQMEQERDSKWKVSDAPEPYLRVLQKAIFGLEILIESVESKFKFEQKMSDENVTGVISGLTQDGKNVVSNFVAISNGKETLSCPHAR